MLQAWFVPRWMRTSPACISVSQLVKKKEFVNAEGKFLVDTEWHPTADQIWWEEFTHESKDHMVCIPKEFCAEIDAKCL